MWNPQGPLGRHVGDAGEIVDHPGVGGPRCRDHPDDVVGVRVGVEGGPQGGAGQTMVVDRHHEWLDGDDLEGLADR